MINPLANFKNPYDIDGEIAKKILNQDQILGDTSKFLDYNKQEEELDLDSNTPNKYENIIFGNITVYKALKGIQAFTANKVYTLEKPNKNWDVFAVKTLSEMLENLENLSTKLGKNKFVKTLFLTIHGSQTSLALKGTNMTAPIILNENNPFEEARLDYEPEYGKSDYISVDKLWFEEYTNFLNSEKELTPYVKNKKWDEIKSLELYDNLRSVQIFDKIVSFIQTNGTLILGGCLCGLLDKELPNNNMLSFLSNSFFKDRKITIIANQDLTRNVSHYTNKEQEAKGKKIPRQYFFLDQNLTKDKDYDAGWRTINFEGLEDNSKKNLKLLSNGKPYEFTL